MNAPYVRGGLGLKAREVGELDHIGRAPVVPQQAARVGALFIVRVCVFWGACIVRSVRMEKQNHPINHLTDGRTHPHSG